jgi:hypothetical protein
MQVIDQLSTERVTEVLNFALFVRAQQAQDQNTQAVQKLEDLWGNFWPEDESVDDFIHTVRRWRREDLTRQWSTSG